MSSISVHLYDLRSESRRDIAPLMQRISFTRKSERWRKLSNGTEVALLDLKRDRNNPAVWLCDFVKRRDVGPGKIRSDSEIDDFAFDVDEYFGEETGAILNLERGWLGAQWNLHGVRAQSMIEYLNEYDHDPESDWVITPKLDPSLEAKLVRKKHLRTAEIKVVASDAMTAELRRSNIPLASALEHAARASKSATISVQMSMSHDAGFLSGDVMRLARTLSEMRSDDVKSVRIRGRDEEFGRDEELDLLEERVVAKFSTRDLEIRHCRYTLASRQRALLALHAGWLAAL